MRLDYNINLNQPQSDPDISMNGDMLLDMQSGLEKDIGNELQQQGQQMQQPGVPIMAPVQPGQKNVVPGKGA